MIEKETRRGTVYALKFTADRQRRYVTLGSAADGWTRDRAQSELAYVLAKVERGVWEPPEPTGPAHDEPDFYAYASDWFRGIRSQLRPATIEAYEYQLSHHLLPHFKDYRLSEITVAEVDRYRDWKVTEARVGAETVNKTLVRLGQILDLALEQELIPRNPLRVNARRRKLRTPQPARSFIERPAHVELLLECTTPENGADVERRAVSSRALLGVLVLAGLRIGEALALTWQDVNLAARQIHVRAAKTSAGERRVDIVPRLRELLVDHRASCADGDPAALVFCTVAGGALDRSYVNSRVLGAAVRRANRQLPEHEQLPTLSPHSLRRTFISLLLFAGQPVPYVMAQAGHADPKVTLSVYARVLACRERGAAEAVQRLVGTVQRLVGTVEHAPHAPTLSEVVEPQPGGES